MHLSAIAASRILCHWSILIGCFAWRAPRHARLNLHDLKHSLAASINISTAKLGDGRGPFAASALIIMTIMLAHTMVFSSLRRITP